MLSENVEFDPEIAFMRVDRGYSGHLSAGDVKRFLADNGIGVDRKEASLFIAPYDDDHDGQLSYQEWLDIIMPRDIGYRYFLETRLGLKPGLTISRSKAYAKRNSKLPYEIEYAVRRIMEGEIELQGLLENAKLKLCHKYEVRAIDFFMEIQSDARHGEYLTYEDIRLFLRSYSSTSVRPVDIEMLILRYDRDNDGKLSYKEFQRMIMP